MPLFHEVWATDTRDLDNVLLYLSNMNIHFGKIENTRTSEQVDEANENEENEEKLRKYFANVTIYIQIYVLNSTILFYDTDVEFVCLFVAVWWAIFPHFYARETSRTEIYIRTKKVL